jgi:hypothetical protein
MEVRPLMQAPPTAALQAGQAPLPAAVPSPGN